MGREARRAGKHGRAALESRGIATRERVEIALAILFGSAVMFGALLSEAVA